MPADDRQFLNLHLYLYHLTLSPVRDEFNLNVSTMIMQKLMKLDTKVHLVAFYLGQTKNKTMDQSLHRMNIHKIVFQRITSGNFLPSPN